MMAMAHSLNGSSQSTPEPQMFLQLCSYSAASQLELEVVNIRSYPSQTMQAGRSNLITRDFLTRSPSCDAALPRLLAWSVPAEFYSTERVER